MSGKKAQRTKGNTQPSSSARSAKFLQNEGQTGLITFSSLTGNLGGVAPLDGGESSLDGEIRLLFRKMAKKDTTTKLKAVQDFSFLCKEKDAEGITNILSCWPRLYSKLAHDYDHRVREATQQAHYQLTTKAGRNLAPHLKQIIVNWLMSQFDVHSPAATSAKLSFDQVFQEKKQKEVLLFCKKEVLQACEKNILQETADTLSDPKVVPLEEREAKYNRFVSSTFQLLRFTLENVENSEHESDIEEHLSVLFTEKKYWRFGKKESPLIKRSFYSSLLTFCERTPNLLEKSLEHLSVTILTHLNEQDHLVTKSLWDCLLYSLATFENLWQFVNVRKAVWPNFWKLLDAGCHGNHGVIYPCLLPFLSHVTPDVAGEGTAFYQEFFSHILNVLCTKKNMLSTSDYNLVIGTYFECIRFLLMKKLDDHNLKDFLVNELLSGKLEEIFYTEDEYNEWYGSFISEYVMLLSHVNESCKNNEGCDFYKKLHTDIWNVMLNLVFKVHNDTASFRFGKDVTDIDVTDITKVKINFYNSLLQFLTCCQSKEPNLLENCVQNGGLGVNSSNTFLSSFLSDIIKCFLVEIFEKGQFNDVHHFLKLVLLFFGIEVLNCANVEKMKLDETVESSNLDICTTFLNEIVQPILDGSTGYEAETVEVMIKIVKLLNGEEKESYLNSIFLKTSSLDILPMLFVEIFKYCNDADVDTWLQSQFVVQEINKMCDSIVPNNLSNEKHEEYIWQVLNDYVMIIGKDQSLLRNYSDILLSKIILCIQGSLLTSKNIEDYIFRTVKSVYSNIEIGSKFVAALFHLFQYNILLEKTRESIDAMNKGFSIFKLQGKSDFLKEMTRNMIEFASNECSNQEMCQEIFDNVRNVILLPKQLLEKCEEDDQFSELILNEILEIGKCVFNSNLYRFYSKLFKEFSVEKPALLGKCSDENLHNLILKCFQSATIEEDSESKSNISFAIKNTEFLHFDLIDIALKKTLQGAMTTNVARMLLSLFLEEELMTEAYTDHILTLTAPAQYSYTDYSCDTYCVVISILDDISCIRALVETYIDDFDRRSEDSDVREYAQYVKIMNTIIHRWHKILISRNIELDDYFDVVTLLMSSVMTWKDNNSEKVLFATSIQEVNPSTILLNIHLIQLIKHFVYSAVNILKGEQWDFLLCSAISWLQSCEESLECFGETLYPEFTKTSFQLFEIIASVFEVSSLSGSVEITSRPSVYLVRNCSNETPAVTNDMITEWKELFLPTAGTSLLRIYTYLMKGDLGGKYTELEQTLSGCIRFLTPFTLSQFVSDGSDNNLEKQMSLEDFSTLCCEVLSTGNWWNKVGSYQLLTILAELVESKLCYISQNEDEDHEGVRAFPPTLIKTMETSRDKTLQFLSQENVSIKHPLVNYESEEGKSNLLSYLLSWQLILQLFNIANPANRALFANYFHNNNDVHDLVTCLFCLLTQNAAYENLSEITVKEHNFFEIRQIAFNLLTISMKCIPALIRNWFNNHVNRGDTTTVNKFVSTLISPILLDMEFQSLNRSSKEFNNMIIKTRPTAREIAAVYTVDEISMELVVQLSANHPLSPVNVNCGKRIGVSNSLWRQWMLQLNTFLSFQNGSILDGLVLWKRNVDKRFEGVEECMICFSVLHGSNYSLPSIRCKTCKKKFHPACLYKWFNTSGKCTCPLCRNTF